MANYQMLQSQEDDYTKAMGQYVDSYDEYLANVQAIKGGSKDFVLPGSDGKFHTPRWDAGQGMIVGGKPWPGIDHGNGYATYTRPKEGDVTKKILKAPAEPKVPQYTRAEATALQNPPMSNVEKEATAPGVVDRFGMRQGNNQMGILAKVMAGKL